MLSEVEKALQARSCNTLHGINPYTKDGHIVGLVWIYTGVVDDFGRDVQDLKGDDYEVYRQRIVENAGLDDPHAIDICPSYGGDFLKVNFTHHHLIPQIINAALKSGLCIRMQTKLQSFYCPSDAPFSLEQSEHLALKGMNKDFQDYPNLFREKVWIFGDQRLWVTLEGKEFARRLKSKFPQEGVKADEDHYLPSTYLDNELVDFPMTVVPLQ